MTVNKSLLTCDQDCIISMRRNSLMDAELDECVVHWIPELEEEALETAEERTMMLIVLPTWGPTIGCLVCNRNEM